MKLFIIVMALFSMASFAQTLPTTGLVIQYDMLTTGGGGTTLTDLSGNGNNGTLSGTTTNSQGRIFNGTTDFITVPQLIGNSDFTAMAIIQPNSGSGYTATGSGAVWSENDNTNNCGSGSCIRFTIAGAINPLVIGSGGSASVSLSSSPYRFPDFDMWYMSRQSQQLSWAMLSRGAVNAQITQFATKFTGTTTVATSVAAMGTVIKSGGNVNFFNGTIAYFCLWSRGLSSSEKQSAYTFMKNQVASRSVFIHPYPPASIPAYSTPTWVRMGAVFSKLFPGATLACSEPSVIYDTNPFILTSLTNVFKMVCSVDATTVGEFYGESPDGLAWTFGNSAIIANRIRGSFLRVGNTYHLYVEHGGGTAFDHYICTAACNTSGGWSLSLASVLTTGSGWDATTIDNPNVFFDAAGIVGTAGTWYMTYEATPGPNNNPGAIGGATATDVNGNVFTKNSANPITGVPGDPFPEPTCYGAYSIPVNGNWYLWCGNFTALKRFFSPTFNGLWIWNQLHASVVGTPYNETNQIGDPSLVQGPCPSVIGTGTCTFMYYVPSGQNGASTGINLVIANMPMSTLVLTNEGATSDWP